MNIVRGVFAGRIQGQGSFAKAGAGTLELSGASGHTGTLAVQQGTVVLSGSTASRNVNVASGAQLALAANGALAANATLGNAGTLDLGQTANTVAALVNSGTLNGAGTLTAATYALNDGSVVNANLGSGALTTRGNVLLNGTSAAGTVDVTRDSTLTLGGAQRLSLQAAVNVDGRLVLANGDQTIRTLDGSGRVDMNAYRLVVTNGGTFYGILNSAQGSSLSTDGGSLTVSGQSNVSTEALTLSNGSSLTLDAGAKLATGAATVQAGSTLKVADSGDLSYTTLGGGGTVDTASFNNATGAKVGGSLTFTGNFDNQGLLAPGYSPGAVTILGDYTESNALELELGGTAAGTQHDQVRVGGTVTVAPNARLTFQTWNGVAPVLGNVYQVVADTSGGAKRINGSFADVLFDADGVAGAAAAVRNAAIVLDVATGRAVATGLNAAGSTFADLGRTRSQRDAAQALFNRATSLVGVNQIDTGAGGAHNVGRNAYEVLTTRDGIAKMTPEYYGAMADYGFSAANSVSRLLVKRAASEFGEGVRGRGGFFAAAQTDSVRQASDARLHRNEMLIGSEFALSDRVEVGGVLASSNGGINGDHGSGTVKGESLRLYAKGRVSERLAVLGGMGRANYRYKLKRDAVSEQATGETKGSTTSFNLGLAYDAYRGAELAVTPYLSVDHGRFRGDGFAEQGLSSHRLVLGDYSTRRTTMTLGSAIEWQQVLAGKPFTLTAHAALQSVLGEGNRVQQATLALDKGVTFPLSYASRQRTTALLGAAGTVRLSPSVSLTGSLDSALSGYKDGSARVQLNVAF